MKQTILFAFTLGFAFTACGQKVSEKKVPAVITDAFKKEYPKAEELKWEKEDGNYEAEFELNEQEYSVLYTAAGQKLETEMEIKSTDLPAAVQTYISQNHAGKKISEASKITATDGTVTYEAEVKGKDLIFDQQGNYLKTKK